MKNFSELGPISVVWRKTSRQPTGGQNTHSNSMHTEGGTQISLNQRPDSAMHPVNQTAQGGPEAERIEWSHKLHVSPATVHHTDAVFSIVRKIYEREPADPVEDLDVNAAIWSIFLNTTPQAAVHLGQDYLANLRFVKNHLWNSLERLLNENGKLISEQEEISGVISV